MLPHDYPERRSAGLHRSGGARAGVPAGDLLAYGEEGRRPQAFGPDLGGGAHDRPVEHNHS